MPTLNRVAGAVPADGGSAKKNHRRSEERNRADWAGRIHVSPLLLP